MFERLVTRFTESERYLDIFLLSMFFTVLAVVLTSHVVIFRFSDQNLAGVIVTLLLSLAMSFPFVRYLLEEEEDELTKNWSETHLLRRHASELKLYLTFFFGATVAFAGSTFMVSQSFYSVQCTVLRLIGRFVTEQCQIVNEAAVIGGNAGSTGLVAGTPAIQEILANNAWVFTSTFLLTFFLSSGIVFILAWNASVLGVWIGLVSDSVLNSAAFIPAVTVLYLPHGVPEIAAYILAGIGGALLSREAEAVLFREPAAKDRAFVVLQDVVIMLVWGVSLLVLGGYIEAL